ncbi:hypothetical protein A2954_02330 [Candidatus Roizmanbacteria bacterium RIFCSPLOWO2_01_FULL_37_12]|uniref:Endonuclease/exonuclease/phosphatase domain-containing protein n=1 Tax=Candidatus Roizmanbacteria bacterium RIFCSPLOWO2_01_FULL_37_12 TaxID=1802056 RepID=A0A1F7I8B2_9BACT|nr:MAG: hypothetical protein A3D76_05300 [Candidatus Roizmanbacteria bacterium RIFCSPHIGHO2_02_FULL_37_9b]OGK39605.1 MAG: hypothetical protein A2954_02330 [Candidatus Roizmanbacteria bacterium RIFCSPLOWO2_01_FULL_37_12]
MKIKFVTLNIFNGNFLAKSIDFLKKENPEIFVLQEVSRGGVEDGEKRYRSCEIIKSEFNDYFCFYTPENYKFINKIKVDSGNAVFSRFPILEQEFTYYSRQYSERKEETPTEFISAPRNLQSCRIKIKNKVLNIFNTHGIWGFDGRDNKERLRMGETISAKVKGLKNVILAGDFNLSPDTETIKKIEKHLRNVFKDELKTTFNMKIKTEVVNKLYFFDRNDLKGFARAVVDMVFVSPDLKVVDKYQPRVDASDHYPLVIIVEI